METEIIEWNNLRKEYKGRVVLDIKHIEFEHGKRHVIVGENGAGKSTFLKMLAGIMKSDCKDNIGNKKLDVSYMPQKPYIFEMTVIENMRKTAKGKRIHELKYILEQLGINDLAQNRATMLSGGEKQRLAFGRIISQPCELLLLDEPCSAMDVRGALLFEQVLQDYQKQHDCTLIMTTHNIAQAKRIADKIIFMKEGKVVIHGDYKKLFYNAKEAFIREYAYYFVGE